MPQDPEVAIKCDGELWEILVEVCFEAMVHSNIETIWHEGSEGDFG